MTLGDIIKNYRAETGTSQDEIAKRSGLSKAYISILERNINPSTGREPVPSMEAIASIANAIGVDFDVLFREINPQSKVSLSTSDFEDPTPDPYARFPEPNVTDDVVTFPVIGTAAAGYDHVAEEVWDGDTVDIPTEFLHGRPKSDYFVVHVQGDSMYPMYIEGDKVLVLKADTLEYSGQVGLMLYNGDEATLKKVEYVMGEDWLRMVPINPMHPVKTIEGVDLELCRVLGIPKLLIREL